MARFVEGEDRSQVALLPECLDDFVAEDKLSRNHNRSRIRARVEHVFGVVKRLWGFNKARYSALAKNATRAFTALALANIFLVRGPLMAQVRP